VPTLHRHRYLDIALVVCGFAVAYSVCAVLKHRHFDSSYDLAIYDQAIWHLSRFEAPASSVRGISSIYGDHFHPILTLLTPLAWLSPSVETLLIAQAVLLALSIVPVYLYARTRLTHGLALGIAIAYACYWGLQQTATFDFHEAAFAPLAVGCLLLALERKQWPLFWAAAVGAAMTKEDLTPFLAFVGAFMCVRGERRRGAALMLGSLLAFVAIVGIVIPWISDAGRYGYRAAYAAAAREPWRLPITLVTPPIKLLTAFLWVAPFALLPLFSPLAVLLVPFALERFLSSSPNHWGTIFHYSAPIAPVVAFAAIDGLARLASKMPDPEVRRRASAVLVGACVVLSALLPGHQPLWRLFSEKLYRRDGIERAAPEALALIPAGASVVAQTCVTPHLSQRRNLFPLEAAAPDAEYVIAVEARSPWPMASMEDVRGALADRRRRGYMTVFDRDGWTVLRMQPGK
jgi:uncharacterized membrane protein